MRWLCLQVTPPFKIIHCRGADRAQNYLALIEHRELNGHPIEVVALHLASLQRHCKYSTLEGIHCAGLLGRCQRTRNRHHRKRRHRPNPVSPRHQQEPSSSSPISTNKGQQIPTPPLLHNKRTLDTTAVAG